MKPLALLLAGAFALTLPAQQAPEPPAAADSADTRILVDVTRVNVLFTVTDKKGRFITLPGVPNQFRFGSELSQRRVHILHCHGTGKRYGKICTF